MNEPDKAKEEVKAEEVGSMEEAFGENDAMFSGSKDAGQPRDLTEAKVVGETEKTLTAEPVDLTGNQEVVEEDPGYDAAIEAQGENITPEDFGKDEAIIGGAHNGENPVVDPEHTTLTAPDVDPDAGTSDDPANDGRLSTVKPKKDIPEEYTIEYLFNPNNNKIFPANEAIVKQKHLIPCTKEGKILPDNRRPSDFR